MDDKVRCSPDAERKQAAEHKMQPTRAALSSITVGFCTRSQYFYSCISSGYTWPYLRQQTY